MQEPESNSSSPGKGRNPAKAEQSSLRELLLGLRSFEGHCLHGLLTPPNPQEGPDTKYTIGERPPPRRTWV